MPIQLKSYAARPLRNGLTTVHTAAAPGVLVSAIAATTNGIYRQTSLGVRRAGSVRWLSQNIATAGNAATSLTPEKVLLETGDELVATSTNSYWQRIVPGQTVFGAGASLLVVNPDATVQVGVITSGASQGIYTSLDQQKSATKTYDGSLSGVVAAGWINGAFRVYTSATTSLVSTDGVTWSNVACTNAPTASASITAGLISGGTSFYGMAGATRVVKTTNGITWTNHAPALPANCKYLAWSGTHLIAGNLANNSNVYRSLSGGAWAAVAVTGTASQTVTGMASNGTGVVVASTNSAGVFTSSDHGATFSSAAAPNGGNNASVFHTGERFLLIYSAYANASASGLPYSFENLVDPQGLLATGGGVCWGDNAMAAPSFTLNGGCTVTASIMEVL